ncbi:MAG: type I restriction enzyme HsdR N-terminal domain-containing protein [Muribaculaceae bacterium]|nr:type I restriction enzyme HsdR N-terminal domain-containing protein [Muribaculaceae bacterium]
MYTSLSLPKTQLNIIIDECGRKKVWDNLRRKYVILTPEEYVRQSFTFWMINYRGYPSSLMVNEIGIDLNGTKKRCDTVVFRPNGHPLMIIEYKAPNIDITQVVFDQIVRYNMVLKAPFLAVSNGIKHFCCKIDYSANTYHFLPELPDYKLMKFI